MRERERDGQIVREREDEEKDSESKRCLNEIERRRSTCHVFSAALVRL